jgi:hypothetical protein
MMYRKYWDCVSPTALSLALASRLVGGTEFMHFFVGTCLLMMVQTVLPGYRLVG